MGDSCRGYNIGEGTLFAKTGVKNSVSERIEGVSMNVKGFILEDDAGREFVMVCEKPYLQPGRTFLLRGWQRRRLVPLQYSEQELRRIVGGVLLTLDDLFKNLPRFSDSVEIPCSSEKGSTTAPLKKPLVLRKVGRGAGCAAKDR